jgi:hypothetical protein
MFIADQSRVREQPSLSALSRSLRQQMPNDRGDSTQGSREIEPVAVAEPRQRSEGRVARTRGDHHRQRELIGLRRHAP